MSERIETETLDRLYLELSQVTKARTGREIAQRLALKRIDAILSDVERSPTDRVLAARLAIDTALSETEGG